GIVLNVGGIGNISFVAGLHLVNGVQDLTADLFQIEDNLGNDLPVDSLATGNQSIALLGLTCEASLFLGVVLLVVEVLFNAADQATLLK
ncbi:MAG: hypothetical protein J6S58_10880, partial [Lentisphaeria bacterium]|nr:hypothetical protein [Lentisphaeria bacterium]